MLVNLTVALWEGWGASFHGVNSAAMAYFKLPTSCRPLAKFQKF